MQIELIELEPCKMSVHYEANALEIMDKRAEVEKVFKKAPVPGNRKNHASIEVIRWHYRQQIDDSLKRALAEDAYHNTLFEKKLRAHGAPKFNNLFLDGGKFTCDFEVLTKPEFELPAWKDMEVPKPHNQTNANDLAESMMQDLRVRLGDQVPYAEDEFVQMGDNIIVDYEGTVDGEKVSSLCTQGEVMTVGKSPLQGFDTNLLGMTAGETREFDFVAPETSLPSLSGKTVHFKVTVTTGSKSVPCALDDSMAAKMGKQTFAELQADVTQAAFARSASLNRMAMYEVVSKRLVGDTQIQVPNWMSLSEAQYLAQQSQLNWEETPDSDKEKLIEMAEQNVKLALILDKIREEEPEAQISDQEVFEMIKQNIVNTKTDKSPDEVIQEMNRTGYLQILFSRIRDEYALDCVVKAVKFID